MPPRLTVTNQSWTASPLTRGQDQRSGLEVGAAAGLGANLILAHEAETLPSKKRWSFLVVPSGKCFYVVTIYSPVVHTVATHTLYFMARILVKVNCELNGSVEL